MRKRISGLLIFCCFLANNQILAQNNETDLDPITITASLSPEKASRTGRDLIIVKGDKFAALPVHSIDELLKYIPGIEVQSRGPMGAQSDIVVRGGTFQQVLVILDGVRLNDPNTGHFTSYIPIAPSEIDRIEILKGASSAIYGSEAVGGVIHIITKTFASGSKTKNYDAIAEITGGQYDLYSVNAGGNYTNGKTSISGGWLSNNTPGQPQRGTNGFTYANTASLSIGHQFNDKWQIALRSAYDNRRFSAQNFYTSFISDTASEKVSTFWNQMQLFYKTQENSVNLEAGYKTLQDRYNFSSTVPPNQNKSNLFQALVSDQKTLSSGSDLVTGVQFLNKGIVSNDRGDHRENQVAAFAVLNQQLSSRLFLSPALRLEWNERSKWQLIPQINTSYRLEKWQFRASAGKTTRNADFTERYNNYNKSFVRSGSIGNPDLESETSFSYEAGVDYFAHTNLKISATFFQRYYNNLIDYVNTPYDEMPRKDNLSPTGIYALAENIAKITTTGVESDIQYDINISDHQHLWTSLGFTWLQSMSSNNTASFYISSHARYLVNGNLIYTLGRISISMNGIYKDRAPQKASAGIAEVTNDYFVLNSRIEGSVIKKRLSVFAEADNLFDRKYADLLGAQMPGRWIMGGIKLSFSKL